MTLNWADFAIAAILLLSVIIGMKRGLVRTVLGLTSIIVSLLLSTWSYPIVADFIESGAVGKFIVQSVEETVMPERNDIADAEEQPRSNGLYFVPANIKKSVTESVRTAEDNAAAAVTKGVSSVAINIISIITVFILVRILMFLLTRILNFMTRLPIIKGVNRFFGGILGAACGVLAIFIFLALLAFNSATSTLTPVVNEVKESYIVSELYDHNFLTEYAIKGKTEKIENEEFETEN